MILYDRTLLRPLNRFKDFIMNPIIEYKESTSYREAMENEDKNEWFKVMQSEKRSLNENSVWSLCTIPQNRKALPRK